MKPSSSDSDHKLSPAAESAVSVHVSARRTRIVLLFLVAVFFVVHLPVMSNPTRYHVDEHYYTDGALSMLQTGDFWVPRFHGGEVRLHKPILTYWSVLAGFKIFGIGFFSARFIFLVAGCLIPLLTYKLSVDLFENRAGGLAAAAMMVSNNELYSSSMRTTPDVLLCLFLCMSLYGFSRLLFHSRAGSRDAAFAYAGAGLAVASKGILGLVGVLFVFCFSFVSRGSPRRIWHPGAALLGIGLAGFWFAVVAWKEGGEALYQFYFDQVGIRTGAPLTRMADNAVAYFVSLPRDFLPWSIVLVPLVFSARGPMREFFRNRKVQALFVGGWYGLLFVVFTAANLTKTRYFLPGYPLVAAFLGPLLITCLSHRQSRIALSALRFPIIAVAALGGALCVFAGAFLDMRIVWAGLAWLVVVLALARAAVRGDTARRLAAVGLFPLMIFAVYDLAIRPVLSVTPAPVWAEQFRSHPPPVSTTVAAYGIKPKYLSQLRVLTEGKVWPRFREGIPTSGESAGILILGETARTRGDLSEYLTEPAGHAYGRVRTPDIWGVIRSRNRAELFEAKRREYYLGFKIED